MAINSSLDLTDFVALWTAHARRVHAYILTLVYNVSDAEDIFQETSATLWEKRHEFEPGTDFAAWATQIAYFQVRNWYRKRRPLQASDEALFDLLSAETVGMADLLEQRFEALNRCVRTLGNDDRKLLKARYRSGQSIREIAAECGRGLSQFYRDLRRIHARLFECIQRRIEKERCDG